MRLIDDLDDPRFGYEATDDHGRTWRYIARGQLFGTSYAPEVTIEAASQRLRLRSLELAAAHGGRDVKIAFHPPTGAWQAWLLVDGEVVPGERRNDLQPEQPPELPPVDTMRSRLDKPIIAPRPSMAALRALYGYGGPLTGGPRVIDVGDHGPAGRAPATRRCAGHKDSGLGCGYRVKAPRVYCKRHDPANWSVDPLTGLPVLPLGEVPEGER